jgi:hypothetical protein
MKVRSFHISAHFRAKYCKFKEKYAKSQAVAVVGTAAALFLCPQRRKKCITF